MRFGVEQNHIYIQQQDKQITLKYHFCLFQMELHQSDADSYVIQIFKSTLESWEFIVGNSLFHAVFTTLATFSPN